MPSNQKKKQILIWLPFPNKVNATGRNKIQNCINWLKYADKKFNYIIFTNSAIAVDIYEAIGETNNIQIYYFRYLLIRKFNKNRLKTYQDKDVLKLHKIWDSRMFYYSKYSKVQEFFTHSFYLVQLKLYSWLANRKTIFKNVDSFYFPADNISYIHQFKLSSLYFISEYKDKLNFQDHSSLTGLKFDSLANRMSKIAKYSQSTNYSAIQPGFFTEIKIIKDNQALIDSFKKTRDRSIIKAWHIKQKYLRQAVGESSYELLARFVKNQLNFVSFSRLINGTNSNSKVIFLPSANLDLLELLGKFYKYKNQNSSHKLHLVCNFKVPLAIKKQYLILYESIVEFEKLLPNNYYLLQAIADLVIFPAKLNEFQAEIAGVARIGSCSVSVSDLELSLALDDKQYRNQLIKSQISYKQTIEDEARQLNARLSSIFS